MLAGSKLRQLLLLAFSDLHTLFESDVPVTNLGKSAFVSVSIVYLSIRWQTFNLTFQYYRYFRPSFAKEVTLCKINGSIRIAIRPSDYNISGL